MLRRNHLFVLTAVASVAAVGAACSDSNNGEEDLRRTLDAGQDETSVALDAGDAAIAPDAADAGKPRDGSMPTDAPAEAAIDAGHDAGVDTGVDAEIDADIDTGVDAEIDAGVDAEIDAGIDAEIDAGIDAEVDAGVDAAIDDAGIDAPVDAPPPAKIVFVTSQVYDGNLGGMAGADAICQMHAAQAQPALTGTFYAWLADSTTSPAKRFTRSTGDYVLTNGVVIAHGWTQLTSGKLLAPIDVTESRGGPPSSTVPMRCSTITGTGVWSGVLIDGNSNIPIPNDACVDWTTNVTTVNGMSHFAQAGGTNFSDTRWTQACGSGLCPFTAALYCFEQ
jgi:hypothetical protein